MAGTPFTDRVLTLVDSCLTGDVAQRLVELRLPPDLQLRLEELAARDKVGRLTSQERDEYSDYVEAIDAVGLIQSRGWMLLHRGRG